MYGREEIYLFYLLAVVFYTERADTSQLIASPADRWANPICCQWCYKNSTLRPVGIDRFDVVKFLANVRPAIEKHILAKVRQNGIKCYVVAEVELLREDREWEVHTLEPLLRSFTYTLLREETFESRDLNQVLQKLVVGLEKYIHESLGWILRRVKQLDIHTVLYKPLRGSSYVELPKTLIILILC